MDERRHRAGINQRMGSCLQHSRQLLVIIQGMLQQHNLLQYNEALQALVDEADDIISGGVIRNLRNYAAFYHRVNLSIRPIIEDSHFPVQSDAFQRAINHDWGQIAENGEQLVQEAPLAPDAWEERPPPTYSAFRKLSSDDYDCERCLLKGHVKEVCNNDVACKTCRGRGLHGWGHLSRECPNARCSHCGEKGHELDICPLIGGPPLCHKCRLPGHTWRTCPNSLRCYKYLLDLFQQQKGVLQARTNLNVFDFTSFMAPYLNNFGNLKNNHMFHIYMGSDGVPKVQIAPYIRSSKWLKAVPDAENWELDVFLTLPPSTEEPLALSPSMEKLDKLMHAARTAKQLLSEEQMSNFLLMEQEIRSYQPIPFCEILSLFSTMNANAPVVASNVLQDPHNTRMDEFMNHNKEYVTKMWNEIEEQIVESIEVLNAPEVLPAEVVEFHPSLPEAESVIHDIAVEQQEPSASSAPTKKKRGRKPKQQEACQNSPEALPAVVNIPKKRGRPVKNTANRTIDNTDTTPPSNSKRPRTKG